MFYNLRTSLARRRFSRQIGAIRTSAPIAYDGRACTIVSMVSHGDLWMYLLAVKSFYRGLGFGRIVVLDDGSLTEHDRQVLTHHLVMPEFVHHRAVQRGTLPRDIMWERLAFLAARCRSDYVIQLDSDTITVASVPQVRDCVLSGRAFILGTPEGQAITSACAAAVAARQDGSRHVQTLCEARLSELPGAEGLRYVRGSAGFFGLPPGGLTLPAAEDFASAMTALVGPRFLEWGSEQVACNFLVANAPGAVVLSHPAHAAFEPRFHTTNSAFLHFIGSYRYHGGEYARLARQYLATAAALS